MATRVGWRLFRRSDDAPMGLIYATDRVEAETIATALYGDAVKPAWESVDGPHGGHPSKPLVYRWVVFSHPAGTWLGAVFTSSPYMAVAQVVAERLFRVHCGVAAIR